MDTLETPRSPAIFDPFDYVTHKDPYPAYRRLRDEHPVYYNAERRLWLLSRFDDVQAAARDWETFASSPSADIDDFGEVLGPGAIIDLDPPRHDELRDIVRSHFAPSALAARMPEVSALADVLIDEFVERDTADLAADFAWQLPVSTISMLLGFPSEDRRRLSQLARDFGQRVSGDPSVPPKVRATGRELRGYFAELLAERKSHPQGDVLSELAAAAGRGAISAEEVIGLCNLLFLAGIETTANLISTSLRTLARQPELAAFLRENPEVMPRAVEEFLRYESPVQQTARRTTRAVVVEGVEIPVGERVLLLFGAANRDERRFPKPDVVDFGREVKRTLAFGEGIHFCLGAPLARPEATIALTRMLDRFEELALCGEPERAPTYATYGLDRLPLALRAAA